MLNELLKSDKKIFKLVCGAGNECVEDVRHLVEIYSKAGAQIFDISANVEILRAAKCGIINSGETDKYICVSVGMKGDPHISKAMVNENLCKKCNVCNNYCLNSAIFNGSVQKNRCIGCGRCEKNCPQNAIKMYDADKELKKILPQLIDMGIDCIELHASSEQDDYWEKWEILNNCFDGILSICIDRLFLGNKDVLTRLKKMLSLRKPYTTIIQADGIPMSAADDEYETTLQAVAMSQIIQEANFPAYIFISGGTNSKTSKLAKFCNINYSGIAVGSYARSLVKDKSYNDSLKLAKHLVYKCIK